MALDIIISFGIKNISQYDSIGIIQIDYLIAFEILNLIENISYHHYGRTELINHCKHHPFITHSTNMQTL